MKIERLQHAMLVCKDVEKSKKFYKEVLRLEEIERKLVNAPHDGAWFKMDNTRFHLAEYKDGHPRIRPEIASDVVWDNHIAFEVDDIEAWKEHFDKLQVPCVVGKLGGDFMKQLYVRDPDNHLIELVVSLQKY
ncbi:MAG: VOC family protein [Verrucomicrobiota bacterium]|nr:VOC family protein [Verrucomicrobiota bacterium]